mmetsp:Transcript_1502/g.3316  ORF Transcript_1502/g.3316 Transcript_1502/m.3316 type:complete len:345 (-) Transcript_1502:98-1132(-)
MVVRQWVKVVLVLLVRKAIDNLAPQPDHWIDRRRVPIAHDVRPIFDHRSLPNGPPEGHQSLSTQQYDSLQLQKKGVVKFNDQGLLQAVRKVLVENVVSLPNGVPPPRTGHRHVHVLFGNHTDLWNPYTLFVNVPGVVQRLQYFLACLRENLLGGLVQHDNDCSEGFLSLVVIKHETFQLLATLFQERGIIRNTQYEGLLVGLSRLFVIIRGSSQIGFQDGRLRAQFERPKMFDHGIQGLADYVSVKVVFAVLLFLFLHFEPLTPETFVALAKSPKSARSERDRRYGNRRRENCRFDPGCAAAAAAAGGGGGLLRRLDHCSPLLLKFLLFISLLLKTLMNTMYGI